ncbi:hypothetical protein F4859DRAFT_514459 [Xylaria cf. heliscus]|nr:hypothetical protein F4859DRAFT_514459 [Xylaria cf. heliscus]
MASRGGNSFGGGGGRGSDRGRGGYRGRSNRGDRRGGPSNNGGGSSMPVINQGTGTAGIIRQLSGTRIRGSREQWQDLLQMIPEGSELDMSFNKMGSGTSQATASNKRARTVQGDFNPAPKSKKMKKDHKDPEVIDPNACGNCGRQDHKAAFCVKAGASGWMEACPKCDSSRHTYEACPQRKKGEEDFIYLVFNRQSKPPVKSTMKLGKVVKAELDRSDSKWHASDVLHLPYSPRFARQEARLNPHEAWTYAHVGNPTEEAKGRVPEPSRTDLTLSNAAQYNSMSEQAWSRDQENFDPAIDGPIPTMRQLKDIRGYRRSQRSIWRATRNTENEDRDRSMSVLAQIRRANMEYGNTCDNCGKEGHVTEKCQSRCGACGDQGHRIDRCRDEDLACTCAKIPCHLLNNCEFLCDYCPAVLDDNDPHDRKDCPEICHACLSTEHKMADCQNKQEKPCGQCQENGVEEPRFHHRSTCVFSWCVVDNCPDRLHCKDHCLICGWAMKDIQMVAEVDKRHICQFSKDWCNDTMTPEIMLRCLKNSDHLFYHHQLVDLHTTVLQETRDLCGKVSDIQKWPVECPLCRLDEIDIVME